MPQECIIKIIDYGLCNSTKAYYICNRIRRNGRVVECGSLENC